MNRTPRSAHGFSIIELMIALALGVVITAGIVQLFVANERDNRLEVLSIASRRGEVRARALVTDVTPVGTVYMTFHFSETPSNLLTSPARDPQAKSPEFKACAVRVEKVSPVG